MRIVDCYTIEINRGDKLSFDYQILNGKSPYTFVEGDVIGFYLYKKGQLDKPPVIEATFSPEIGKTAVEINISADEMNIGELKNMQQEYWYEITLNDEITLGYDSRGPKLLILYPKGKR